MNGCEGPRIDSLVSGRPLGPPSIENLSDADPAPWPSASGDFDNNYSTKATTRRIARELAGRVSSFVIPRFIIRRLPPPPERGRFRKYMISRIDALIAQVGGIVVGKDDAVRLAVACLLAGGHLLIEDIPGVGKTTLSHALARSIGLNFRRIQFTSDLLPADILGNSIFDKDAGKFVFHAGPLFSQVVLIDEVNRATPKTQSALLEAMEEQHVTVDGITHALPEPFFVLATQNPLQQIGTFPLPESQLDRFLMRIELGVPDRAAERTMLMGEDRRAMLRELQPVLDAGGLREIQAAVREIHAAPALIDYLQDLLQASREQHRAGLSPRSGLALLRAARAWALMQGRDMALPEDIQAVGAAVMGHRLGPGGFDGGSESGRIIAERLLRTVPVP